MKWNSHSREIITKKKKTNIFSIGNTIKFLLTFFVGSLSFTNKLKKIYWWLRRKRIGCHFMLFERMVRKKSNWLRLRRGRNQLKERKINK